MDVLKIFPPASAVPTLALEPVTWNQSPHNLSKQSLDSSNFSYNLQNLSQICPASPSPQLLPEFRLHHSSCLRLLSSPHQSPLFQRLYHKPPPSIMMTTTLVPPSTTDEYLLHMRQQATCSPYVIPLAFNRALHIRQVISLNLR